MRSRPLTSPELPLTATMTVALVPSFEHATFKCSARSRLCILKSVVVSQTRYSSTPNAECRAADWYAPEIPATLLFCRGWLRSMSSARCVPCMQLLCKNPPRDDGWMQSVAALDKMRNESYAIAGSGLLNLYRGCDWSKSPTWVVDTLRAGYNSESCVLIELFYVSAWAHIVSSRLVRLVCENIISMRREE